MSAALALVAILLASLPAAASARLESGAHRSESPVADYMARPAWSPDGRHIVFYVGRWESNDIDNWALYIMDANGRKVRRLTPFDWYPSDDDYYVLDQCADWTPVGGEILFPKPDPHGDSPGLALMRADGTHMRKLTDGDDWCASVSPSGRFVAYGSEYGALYLIDRWARTRPRRLTHQPYDAEPSWSPDGRWLVYVRTIDYGNYRSDALYLIHADGTGAHRILTALRGDSICHPTWSPDGRLIAFSEGPPDGFHDLHVVRPDGSGLRRLTKHLAEIHSTCPDWAPDGRSLVYARQKTDGYRAMPPSIWTIRRDGTHPHKIGPR